MDAGLRYRFKMLLGAAFICVAGAILLFAKITFKVSIASLPGIVGTLIVLSPMSRTGASASRPKVKHQLAANVAVLILMAAMVVVGIVYAVTH